MDGMWFGGLGEAREGREGNANTEGMIKREQTQTRTHIHTHMCAL